MANTPVAGAGGAFTQPTNSGHFVNDHFSVLPEVNVNIGCEWRFARVFVGYTFMYASEVVQPGDQIDRVINTNQSSVLSGVAPPGPLSGAARPAPVFNTTDFWARGINFGLELRF